MLPLPIRLKKCLDELTSHYRLAAAEDVQFSEPPDVWQPQWDKRSQCLALAEDVHQSARPLMAQWRKESDRYPPMVRKQMKKYTDGVVALIKTLDNQNRVLFQSLSKAKGEVKDKLQSMKKSSRAISCYAAQR